MKRIHWIFATAFIFSIAIFGWRPATAQDQPAPQPATATPPAAAADTLPAPAIDESGKNVRIFLDKVEVLGSIAKPQALFIIPGNDPKVDGIQIDRSFFREIFRSMEKDRFPRISRSYPRGQIPW
ncbi:hypothetical protein L0337_36940 [candidate division KSB1 bacterium]|nr:hypothetical protein [candidate division KSB1 bacterium]